MKLEETSISDALQMLNITTIIADARKTDFEAGSIEYFVSNSTFEHIPPDILSGIMKEFRRIGRDNALGSHLIDLSDHYSHFDKNITPYNFLKYSDHFWRVFDNELLYQNRLRVSDYRRIHMDNGFEIIAEKNTQAAPTQIEQIQLADTFKSYAHEDLIVITSFMVSRV